MYLMFREGLISVVQHDSMPNIKIVRAWEKEHLKQFLKLLPETENITIQHTPKHDYPYKVFLDESVVRKLMSLVVDTVSYYKFKPSVRWDLKDLAEQIFYYFFNKVHRHG